ncbi:MAG TPA: tetratricopeptide repeat protein [Acidobacteriaceae bacterium]
MNGSNKSRSLSKTITSRYLWSALVVASLLTVLSAAAQQATPQHSAGATIDGRVFDAAGKPADNATVRLEENGTPNPLETHTDAAGVYAFSARPSGSYLLTAEKSGLRTPAPASITLSAGDRQHVNLVLKPSGKVTGAPAMGFSDTPNFTVAGITDWTAVGGHGSDAILRTSEDLARETLTLRHQGAGSASTDSMTAANSERSESQLRAALAAAPESFAANHKLGLFYFQAGRYRESVPLLEASYRIDPTNNENERDLILAYENSGDLKQAREHTKNLLKRQNNADVHRMAGDIDEKLGDPLDAVQQYQQATSLDPSEQNYFAWGSELLLHRAVWQAAEVFRNGVKEHPKSARLMTALGTALFAGALYDEAARSLCDASDLDPANPEPYLFMGKVEMAAPTPSACIESKLARFVQQKPDSSIANYLYAMALLKRQQASANKTDLQKVETLLNKAVSLDAKCSDGYLQLGILAASQRDDKRAIQLYSKAAEIDPQLAEAHYRLAVAYERLGEREKAQQEFQLHDEIQKRQAADIERERRDVKQFVIVQGQPASTPVTQ